MRIAPFLFCLWTLPVFAGAEVMPSFIPLPAVVEAGAGRFRLTGWTEIVAPGALANEADFLAKHLRRASGFPLPVVPSGRGVALALDGRLPAEGYALEITAAGVTIRGGSAAGVFYGVQTFMQALPAAVYGTGPAPLADWSAPALRITDRPAMAWRGVMLDSARHFQPKAFILKFVDAIAAQKLNRFHWRLADNESWRLEIKKYPKLTRVMAGAPAYYPEEIPTNPTMRTGYRYGWMHDAGFYSQEDVREIVAYAARRHVVIIPELELPGHATAALTAYPEFSVTGKVPVVRSSYSPDLFDSGPAAVRFLEDVLDETTALFPGPWVHLGGDEVPKGQWKDSVETGKRIDALGLRIAVPGRPDAPEEALHVWLLDTLAAHLAKSGRRAIGWEEVSRDDHGDRLDKTAVVETWLRPANAVKAANSGHDIILADGFALYLDSRQATGPGEPHALYDGPFTAQSIHRFNLTPAGITPENRTHILGAEASLWTELMPRTDDVEYQAFPRVCSLAELTWTAPDRRADTADFMNRLLVHGERLTALGLNHRRVEPGFRIAWNQASASTGIPEAPLPEALIGTGVLSLDFNYERGVNGLGVTAVELLAGGKVIAADRHPGFAGMYPRDAAYALNIPASRPAGPYVLRITARGEGGSDSAGEILIRPAP